MSLVIKYLVQDLLTNKIYLLEVKAIFAIEMMQNTNQKIYLMIIKNFTMLLKYFKFFNNIRLVETGRF